MNFVEKLEMFKRIDDDMLPEEFDPGAFVNDLREDIDAITWRIKKWEDDAKFVEKEYLKKLSGRIASLKGKAIKFRKWLRDQMLLNNIEALPGKISKVRIQDSQKKFNVYVLPDADMYLRYPQFVVQKTTYEWNKGAIEALPNDSQLLKYAAFTKGKQLNVETVKGTSETFSIEEQE